MKHQPVDWFTIGRYPWCSCGFDPRDNLKLIQHWRDNGIRWHDDHGALVGEPIIEGES